MNGPSMTSEEIINRFKNLSLNPSLCEQIVIHLDFCEQVIFGAKKISNVEVQTFLKDMENTVKLIERQM